VLATCAGAILLARTVEDAGVSGHRPGCFGTLDMRIVRNAYGRQLGSFHTDVEMSGLGRVPATFIRAPRIADVDEGVEVLAQVDGCIVVVRQGVQMAMSFHPELDASDAVHRRFLEDVGRRS